MGIFLSLILAAFEFHPSLSVPSMYVVNFDVILSPVAHLNFKLGSHQSRRNTGYRKLK